jgi:hypothetical protein
MTVRSYALVTSLIFLVVAIVHVARLIGQWEVMIGPWQFPAWGSIVAVIVSGFLSFAGFRLFQAQRFSWFR